jgi:hypothetical protein
LLPPLQQTTLLPLPTGCHPPALLLPSSPDKPLGQRAVEGQGALKDAALSARNATAWLALDEDHGRLAVARNVRQHAADVIQVYVALEVWAAVAVAVLVRPSAAVESAVELVGELERATSALVLAAAE